MRDTGLITTSRQMVFKTVIMVEITKDKSVDEIKNGIQDSSMSRGLVKERSIKEAKKEQVIAKAQSSEKKMF